MKKINFKNGSMEIKNQTEQKAELYFYGDIVSSSWKWEEEDTCPEDVKKFLDSVKEAKELDIFINSGGGSVFAGMTIYNMLKRNPANKTVYIDGLAGSIASVIALSGDRVIIPKNAYFMIHKPTTGVYGNSNDFLKTASVLETIEQGILQVYKDHLKEGAEIETIKQLMEEETWFTGEQASEYFNIEVGEELQAVACVSDLTTYSKAPKIQESTAKKVESFFDIRKKLVNI